MPNRVFLLSPADCGGKRARRLLQGSPTSEVAGRLRESGGMPVGELFTCISSLYFRAKLAYARQFAAPPLRCPEVMVIVPGFGLLGPDVCVSLQELEVMARTSVDPKDPGYMKPLTRDLAALRTKASRADRFVLLGSVATDKYVAPLVSILQQQCYIPKSFVGRGSMSRGGLMLRAIDVGRELEYVRVATAVRRGARPPRLGPRTSR